MYNLSKYYHNRWVVSDFRVLYRVLRGFLRAKIFGLNTLRVIELFPTFSCQSSCEFCSVGKYIKSDSRIMDLDDYRSLARDGAKMGATVVTILGGEPLLYKNICDLVFIFKQNGYYTHIVSNGLALTEGLLAELKSSGLDCIYFSLESMDADKNDAVRGAGHHAKVMENIQMVKGVGLGVGLSTVMLPGALEQAIDVIEFCHAQGINASGGQIAPVGKAEGSDVLSKAEFKRVRDLLDRYPRLTFDWVFSYFMKPRCPAGKEKVGVTCYGDVVGCSYNPVSFGNYFDSPLKAIVGRMRRFSQFAKDFPGCLSSEDVHYIDRYLGPLGDAPSYPVYYDDHPAFGPDAEPGLYGGGE